MYGVRKRVKSDKGVAFTSKECKEFCRSQKIDRVYGTATLQTGTGLVERTIQSLKNKTLANLEDGQNLRESVNRALYVLRFTILCVHYPDFNTRDHGQFGYVNEKDGGTKIQTKNDFPQAKKPTCSVRTNKIEYFFKFYEKNYKRGSLESKFKNKIQIALPRTEHTVTKETKTISRTLISNSLPFQQTNTVPTKRVSTRQNTAEQPTCFKTLDATSNGGASCIYSMKEAPKHR